MSLVTTNSQPFQPESMRIFGSVSFLVIASKIIRPGHIYRLSVTNYTPQNVLTRVSLLRDGIDIESTKQECMPNVPETIILKVNNQALLGSYKLRIEGRSESISKSDTRNEFDEVVFFNETQLIFDQRSITILIQTDKPIYKQEQVVKFRTMPITTDLKPFADALDVFMVDPNGIIVKRWLSQQTNLGSVSLEYPLSKQLLSGNWTIRVSAQGQIKEKRFIVEEYYPQQFEVKVDFPSVILDSEEYISGTISSNFTSGAAVLGNLTIVLTAEVAGQTAGHSITEPVFDGIYHLKYQMTEFKRLIGYRNTENAKLTVTAYVGEQYLNTFNSGFAKIRISSSRVKLQFIKPSVYVFNPKMPFDCYLILSHIDGSQYSIEKLKTGFLEVRAIAMNRFGSAMLPNKTIEVKHESPGVWKISIEVKSSLTKQALLELDHLRIEATYNDFFGSRAVETARAYRSYSPSQRSIRISTSSRDCRVGNYAVFHVSANYDLKTVSFLVMSKGLILTTGREQFRSSPTTFSVPISAEMAPISTIVIYDVAKNNELVMDALSFHVVGTYMNNFNIVLNQNKDKQGETVEVSIYGEPGTYVGLSAFSHELESLSYSAQMTASDLNQQMQDFDHQSSTVIHQWLYSDGRIKDTINFPSPSNSIDAMNLLNDVGLIVFTDAIIPRKSTINCGMGLTQCLAVDKCYNATVLKCNGKDDCGDTSDESGCEHLTSDMTHLRLNEHVHRVNRLERLYLDNWLWKDVNIGPLGHYIFTTKLPTLNSNWSVNAISMSPERGISILRDPIQLSSARPFILKIELPPYCNIGEQVTVKAIVSNFDKDETMVSVILAASPDYRYITLNEAGEVLPVSILAQSHEHLVSVKPQETTYVNIPIVARTIGMVNVTVSAITQIAKRSITKSINVGSDGITQRIHTSLAIDLTQSSYMTKNFDTSIGETPIVKYDNVRRYIYGSNKAIISLSGGVVGSVLPRIPVDSNTILRLPSDCGEQNMFNFAMNLMSISYLRHTNQETSEIRREVFKNLNLLYQRQLTFRNRDGAFKVFKSSNEPSVWLTAFATQYFHQATSQEWENYIFIDPEVIELAISWLVSRQTPEGSFVETSTFAHDRKFDSSPRYHSNVEDFRMKNISLTAYVLIALHSIKERSGDQSSKASNARNLAQKYLESMLHRSNLMTAQDPFDLSLVTYALQKVNSMEADEAYNHLEKKMIQQAGMKYWSIEQTTSNNINSQNNRVFISPKSRGAYDSRNVQTTAYALLTHIHRQTPYQMDIVEWLNSQRISSEGWASTQDTIVAFQALTTYSLNSDQKSLTNIKVTVESPALRSIGDNEFFIKESNISRKHSIPMTNAWGNVKFIFEGTGVCFVNLDIQYNVDWPQLQIKPAFNSFDLDIKPIYSGRNSSIIHMDICSKWTLLSENLRSGMAVLEVSVPTGYMINQGELDRLVNSTSSTNLFSVRNLRESRFEGRKVYFYFDYIDSKPSCVQFSFHRWYPTANMTRYLPVRIYDYYAPERFNETMLSLYNLYALSICDVCGSSQCAVLFFIGTLKELNLHTKDYL